MTATLTLATAGRVLAQLRRDHRTIAMLLVAPCVLLWLFSELFDGVPGVFDRVAPTLLALFPFFTMFLVTSIAMVRERTSGTLERLLTTPLGKADLVLGYGLAFAVLACVQAVLVCTVALLLLDLEPPASIAVLVLLAVASAVLGAALGLGFSALATTEFQAVQFVPVVVLPQVLLCGLFVPTDRMAGWLEAVSSALPLTYAVHGTTQLTGAQTVPRAVWTDLAIVTGFAVAALAMGATTLRRRS